MHPNAQRITDFYTAFSNRDGAAMAAAYAADATFSDPAFPGLKGAEIGGMWQMLTGRAKDLRIEFSGIEADDTQGKAHWEAWYTFSATGRAVHNIIDAQFTFNADGQIQTHVDTFGFHRWSRQALGMPGLLLGWTGFLKKKVQGQARKGLAAFMRAE
jgi:ketosteroid isomerase-like protein